MQGLSRLGGEDARFACAQQKAFPVLCLNLFNRVLQRFKHRDEMWTQQA